jgi:ribosomal protein S18 acetylase RimI-like enzyme
MKVSIRPAETRDLASYTKMMQKTYEDAYIDESIGLSKECFSKEVFNSNSTQEYLASKLVNDLKRKTWLAVDRSKIIGSVTIEDDGNNYEMTGFYVLPNYQRTGIGKQLWQKVQDFAKDKDIVLDIYSHNKKTIEMYKKWGFVVDEERGIFYRHWPEWPDGVQAESLYMRRSK